MKQNGVSIMHFQDLKSKAQVTQEAAFTDKENSQRTQSGLNIVNTVVLTTCY